MGHEGQQSGEQDEVPILQALAELARDTHACLSWMADSGIDGLAMPPASERLLQAIKDGPPPRAQTRRQQPTRVSRTRQSKPTQPRAEAPKIVQPQQWTSPSQTAAALQRSPPPKTPTLDLPERTRRLELIKAEAAQCRLCRLHETRTNTVFSRGAASASLVFVGEGPDHQEDLQGIPFVGPAGQLLDKMIKAMGCAEDEVYICNIVKCRPPKNRKPEADEIAACKPYLERQLEILAPKAIVSLGATAIQGLLGTRMGITRMRGQWKLYRGRIPVMPTFHPANLLRQPENKRDVWNDLKAVMKRLGKVLPQR